MLFVLSCFQSAWTYCNLQDQLIASVVGFQRIENGRQRIALEFNYKKLVSDHDYQFALWVLLSRADAELQRGSVRIFRTIHNGTNDRMDLASPCRICAGPSLTCCTEGWECLFP
jgi:hypothetical protein